MGTDRVNGTFKGTVHETLGIEVVEAGPDRVVLQMPVGPQVYQPMGLLHGGVSAIIAESAASIGAYMNCDPEREYAVGVELNVSHLRARTDGSITVTATPIRKGRSMHVWGISIEDEDGKAVAVARCTLAIRILPGSS